MRKDVIDSGSPADVSDLIENLGGLISDHRVAYSHTRFPYTYACDFVRAHTRKGRGEDFSRGDASKFIRDFANEQAVHEEDLFTILALMYMQANGIEAP